MKNKKGFTLIELLAVIAILAILLILAIPNVIKMFNKAKVNSFVTEVQSIINSASKQYMSDQIGSDNITQYCYDGTENSKDELELSGKNVKYNIFFKNGNITSAQVISDNYAYNEIKRESIDTSEIKSENVSKNASQLNINCGLKEEEIASNLNKEPVNITIKVENGSVNDTTEISYENIEWGSNQTYELEFKANEGYSNISAETDKCSYNNGKVIFTNIQSDTTCNIKLQKITKLTDLIMPNPNSIPTLSEESLKKTSYYLKEHGLYKSNNTQDGNYTYFFRGGSWCEINGSDNNLISSKAVCENGTNKGKWKEINNYVEFAGSLWRIVRIVEDGTIKLIKQDTINDDEYLKFVEDDKAGIKYMYYSNGKNKGARKKLLDWYNSNLKSYESKISNIVLCEQAKVAGWRTPDGANAIMTVYDEYNPSFKCAIDGNGYGIVKDISGGTNTKIGLITIDEAIYAGGYGNKPNYTYYLNIEQPFFTMSGAGYQISTWIQYGVSTTLYHSYVWQINYNGHLEPYEFNSSTIRPVISLKADVKAVGLGTKENPYVIE